MVVEIIPILERLLSFSDLRVLESNTRAILRIVEWAAKFCADEFEDIVSKSLIQTVRNVSAPDGSCANSPLIMTILIKILACTAKTSHKYAGLLVGEMDVFPHIIHSLSGRDSKEASIANQSPEHILGILALASDLLPVLPNEGIWSLGLPLVEEYKSSDHCNLRLKAFEGSFFKRYFSEIIPVLIHVFGITVNHGIRRKCLECVSKAVWFTDKDPMETIDISFIGKFISDLIGLSQSFLMSNETDKELVEVKAFVAAGLSITYVLLTRYDERFRKLFKREGVISQIRSLLESIRTISDLDQKDAPNQEEPQSGTNVDDMIMNIVQDLNEIEDKMTSKRNSPDQSEKKEDDASPLNQSSESQMARMMNNMRNAFESIRRDDQNMGSSSSRKNIRSISGDRYTSNQVIEWMKTVSEKIITLLDSQAGKSDEISVSLSKINDAFAGRIQFVEELQTFAALLLGNNSATGLTGFELLESGIVNSLWSFLVYENQETDTDISAQNMKPIKERLQNFFSIFFNVPSFDGRSTFVDGAFQCLVNRLQECLSRSESFLLATAVPRENVNSTVMSLLGTLTGMGVMQSEMNNPVMQLAKQIRVKLVSGDLAKDKQPIMVRIHAVATFKALEEYLKTRLEEDENFETISAEIDDLDGFEEDEDEDDVEPMDEEKVIKLSLNLGDECK